MVHWMESLEDRTEHVKLDGLCGEISLGREDRF